MRIAVCIKQVPNTAEIRIDPVKGTLIRSGVPSIMNPHDRHALECALRLRESQGGSVTVVTMGPAQAQAVLREALAVGADEVVLASDRAFGGSDTYATSYILAAVLRHVADFDLVLGGKQAIDGDTGQTMPSIAEHLGMACISNIVEIAVDADHVVARRRVEEGIEIVEARLPLAGTVALGANKPRFASIQGKISSLEAAVREVHADDLSAFLDRSRIGLKGSPTKVRSSFVPQRPVDGILITGSSADMADELVNRLESAKVL